MTAAAQPEVEVIQHERHEDWCNRQHQAGADPRERDHGNIWRSSTEHPAMGLKALFYPVTDMRHGGALVAMDFTGCGGTVVAVLTTADARALAQRLMDMADASDRG
jgi:hypothetical protein